MIFIPEHCKSQRLNKKKIANLKRQKSLVLQLASTVLNLNCNWTPFPNALDLILSGCFVHNCFKNIKFDSQTDQTYTANIRINALLLLLQLLHIWINVHWNYLFRTFFVLCLVFCVWCSVFRACNSCQRNIIRISMVFIGSTTLFSWFSKPPFVTVRFFWTVFCFVLYKQVGEMRMRWLAVYDFFFSIMTLVGIAFPKFHDVLCDMTMGPDTVHGYWAMGKCLNDNKWTALNMCSKLLSFYFPFEAYYVFESYQITWPMNWKLLACDQLSITF